MRATHVNEAAFARTFLIILDILAIVLSELRVFEVLFEIIFNLIEFFPKGKNCEIDLKPCDSNPCLNKGTCINSRTNSFKCKY